MFYQAIFCLTYCKFAGVYRTGLKKAKVIRALPIWSNAIVDLKVDATITAKKAKIASNNINGVVIVPGWSGAEIIPDRAAMVTVRYVTHYENYGYQASSSVGIPDERGVLMKQIKMLI